MNQHKIHLQDILDMDDLVNTLRKYMVDIDDSRFEHGFKVAIAAFGEFFEKSDPDFFQAEQFYNFVVRDNTKKYHAYFSKKVAYKREEHGDRMTRITFQVEACDIDNFPELKVGEFLRFYTIPSEIYHKIIEDPNDDDVCTECGIPLDDHNTFDEEDDL